MALQIEDFLSPSSTTPLSSVPLQFLVIVFSSSAPCSAQPVLVADETPADGSCIPVEFGTDFTAGIVATSGGLGYVIKSQQSTHQLSIIEAIIVIIIL